MAKVFYSGLVNRMAGRVSHSVMSNWKGTGMIKRHNAGPHQPRTEKQQDVRGYLNDLAGEYYALTAVQKSLWDAFAAAVPFATTALASYVQFNLLCQKYFPGTARKTAPPPSPATPAHAVGFTVTPKASGVFSVIWTSPVLTTLFAIADYWIMPGYDNTVSPTWTFGATAGADATFVDVSTSAPTGSICKFRIRTIDAQYRVSPWSHMLTSTAL